VNWLDLLLGRIDGGEGVRREILSFERTFSASIGTRPLAAKLFWTVGSVDWKVSSRSCWYSIKKSSLWIWLYPLRVKSFTKRRTRALALQSTQHLTVVVDVMNEQA
jgi:hypothetical protein